MRPQYHTWPRGTVFLDRDHTWRSPFHSPFVQLSCPLIVCISPQQWKDKNRIDVGKIRTRLRDEVYYYTRHAKCDGKVMPTWRGTVWRGTYLSCRTTMPTWWLIAPNFFQLRLYNWLLWRYEVWYRYGLFLPPNSADTFLPFCSRTPRSATLRVPRIWQWCSQSSSPSSLSSHTLAHIMSTGGKKHTPFRIITLAAVILIIHLFQYLCCIVSTRIGPSAISPNSQLPTSWIEAFNLPIEPSTLLVTFPYRTSHGYR